MAAFIKLANNINSALNWILDTENMGLDTIIKSIYVPDIMRFEQDTIWLAAILNIQGLWTQLHNELDYLSPITSQAEKQQQYIYISLIYLKHNTFKTIHQPSQNLEYPYHRRQDHPNQSKGNQYMTITEVEAAILAAILDLETRVTSKHVNGHTKCARFA
jgi:hypothetical protein